MEAQYLEVGGVLGYVERAGAGQPVLCVHTAGQSGAQWRRVTGELAAHGYEVVVPDLPGHGRSEPALSGPIEDLHWYAEWCAELIDVLGLDRPFVVGCSIGGRIALDLAVHHGTRLAGAVSMAADAGADSAHSGVNVRGLRRELSDSAAPSRSDRTELGTLAVVGRAVSPETARLIATMHRREDPAVSTSDLIGWAQHDLRERLRTIACPVHVVAGEDDLWLNIAAVEYAAAAIPDGRFTRLDGIGHYPMEEMPDFAELLDRWLQELQRTAAPREVSA